MSVSKRIIVVLSLLVVSIVLTACAPSQAAMQPPSQEFMLKLPQIEVAIDENGVPTFGGLSATTLYYATFGQVNLTWMRMDPALVSRLMDIGLQHVEVLQNDTGLYIFVNGEALPNVAWSPETIEATAGMLNSMAGIDPSLLRLLNLVLPYVQNVGVDLIMRFPVAAGAEPVPLRDPSAPLPAPAPAAEGGGLALQVQVIYDDNGVPSVPGASFILKNMLGIDVEQLALNKYTIDLLKAQGIQSITVNTKPDGVQVSINENTLPKLVWSEDQLRTTLSVLSDFYLGAAGASITQVIENIIPALGELDLQLVLVFPSG
ncbi:MAG: hypothetical protein D6775_10715 [Caldilineae bacterium]|nr:MAG: hypothetical protein D6775_10715 [Caldilineae bacterium]